MRYIRIIACIVISAVVLFCGPSCAALGNNIDVAYTLDYDNKRVSTPKTYTYLNVIRNQYDGLTLSDASDLYISEDNELFVADTGNNRILKLSLSGELLAVIDNSEAGGLIKPKGVCSDKAGNIYIADTGNQRIVVLDSNGKLIRTQGKPDSDLLESVSSFEPTKISISNSGMLYVLVGKEFMSIDENNTFLGYVGSAQVGFSLKNLFIRLFASETQKRLVTSAKPDQYNNFSIASDNMVYAVSYGVKNQIKKISSVGDNIYPKGHYGEYSYNEFNVHVRPNFSDITVSSSGIIFAADNNTGKVYMYDQNGTLLSVFGGKGNSQEHFLSVTGIEMDSKGNLYILDSGYGNIQILKPTEFANLVIEATYLFEMGEYDDAFKKWQAVLEIDEGYLPALNATASILYKMKDYESSKEYYRLAGNQNGYGKAMAKDRHDFISTYFAVLCIVGMGIFFGLLILIMNLKKYADKSCREMIYGKGLASKGHGLWQLSVQILFHPIDCGFLVKRNRVSIPFWYGACILFIAGMLRILQVYITGYSFNQSLPEKSNALILLILLLAPMLTWIVASYSTTTLMNGSASFKELFVLGSLCYIPYIILSPIKIIISHIMSGESTVFYNTIGVCLTAWIIILAFIFFMNANNYSISKALAVGGISVIVGLLIWAFIILFFVFIMQAVFFVQELTLEIYSQLFVY